ncbi:MAG: asparagine--tRNA ligase [Bdellovibrionales bacterium RIFOXYB1_FULL_37_110]|nr:MAG: asparagine--tRNA ligase [Bdellovibrionales bacterium RIFOXYC1_FULL_37_79]OFZ59350.1 MAG: asparagine--tRNA ligase [Bdellovibrionales bacterium RIFOXYB1_FULL_37_110]OFZ61910.1 MAG: asparagine--tRNA ligase [Bdellovibrionales bacterium RIFOXYD1_FULL_36_51]
MSELVLIKNIIKDQMIGKEVTIKGWVKSTRKKKSFSFIVLNDGSNQSGLQIVADAQIPGYDNATNALTGSSLSITGKVVASQGQGQSLELQASVLELLGPADETFPLQKKATSLEFLRENAHLRSRTNTMAAVMRVRSSLAFATHSFFNARDFLYLHTPIITGSDCEGAGEMFKVTTLDLDHLPRNEEGKVDYKKDYYGKDTGLTVSGQLNAETYACGMGRVYTFGPTFRAENSNTPRHASEFWMIEPEVAFFDLEDVANLAIDYIKHLINHALNNNLEDLTFLQSRYKEDLIASLTKVSNSPVNKITYTQAIDILQKAKVDGHHFDFPVEWGSDLQTEHERFLSEKTFDGPVIVTDYPKAIKSFYMKQNSDGKTVRAMDILVPGVGEIIGGSQREDDYGLLLQRINELGLKKEDYWWYLDLRKYGTVPHSGFGLGFERAIMYITGMQNIRDVIAFPRTPGNAEF